MKATLRGSIIQRSKTSWTIVLSMGRDPITAKRKQQWVSVKGTKKDAEKRLAELLRHLDTGGYVKPTKETVGEFLLRWLRDYAWPNVAPSTAEGYQHVIKRHLIPALGAVPLNQLRPDHVQAYAAAKLESGRIAGGGLSPKTVRHHLVTLHDALATAMRWGLVSRNVVDAVDKPRAERKEMATFDESGFWRFLEAAKETSYYALFYTALFTGLRRGELLALRWDDVDLILSQVSVSRSVHQLDTGAIVYRQPKTAKGRRLVALSPSIVRVLQDHHGRRQAECILLGQSLDGSHLVFSQADGSSLLPDSVTHAWIKLVRRTGFAGLRLHDARHTHATRLLRMGVHPKIV